ncbi:MAG: response regulator [Elusimicrobia bacterium]|nr:response regulator [Elusimicrobiota bacterium]
MSVFGLFAGRAPLADVLVVDDDASIRSVLLDALGASGLKVAEAEDGRRGYAEAKRLRPRLILLDVDMPSYTGLMALEGLKADAETKDIPVVMVTARALTREVDEALRRGASGYITKPFDLRLVLKKVSGFVPLPSPPPGL